MSHDATLVSDNYYDCPGDPQTYLQPRTEVPSTLRSHLSVTVDTAELNYWLTWSLRLLRPKCISAKAEKKNSII